MNSVFSVSFILAIVVAASAYPKQKQYQNQYQNQNQNQYRDGDDNWPAYGNKFDSSSDGQYDTLRQTFKDANQKTIDDYKSGALNDEQFKTHMYINQYEYDQSLSDYFSAQFNNAVSNIRGMVRSSSSTDEPIITRL